MYIVFGYDDMCFDFSYRFDSFLKALLTSQELDPTCIVFMVREKRFVPL